MDNLSFGFSIFVGTIAYLWFFVQMLGLRGKKDTPNTQDNEKLSLASFIEENHKLITTLGVFSALTVFVSNLSLKGISYFLSFLFLVAAVLVWLEIWAKFPRRGTNRLFWFENVLSMAVVLLALYLILQFQITFRPLLTIALILMLLWMASLGIKRFDIFEIFFRAKDKPRNNIRFLFGLLVILLISVIGVTLSNWIAPPLFSLLSDLGQALEFSP